MNYLQRIWYWLKYPWPLHVCPLLIGIHLLVINYFTPHATVINLWFSTGFQVVGGILVLLAIDSNLNIISNSSIKNSFIKWIKSFPLKPKSSKLEPQYFINSNSFGKARAIVTPKMTTLEDKIIFLLQEIKRVDEDNQEIRKEFSENVDKSERKIVELEKTYNFQIKEIKSKINEITIGGIKLEVLGVLCIIYGLFILIIWHAQPNASEFCLISDFFNSSIAS